eukprot:819790-Rhodomonas_salina.1
MMTENFKFATAGVTVTVEAAAECSLSLAVGSGSEPDTELNASECHGPRTFSNLKENATKGICIEKATNHLKLGVQGLQGDVPRCVCGCQSILCTNTTKMALTCVPRAAAPALFTVLLCMAAVPASAFVAVPAKFSTTHDTSSDTGADEGPIHGSTGLKLNLHATGRRTSARCPPSATSLRMSVYEAPTPPSFVPSCCTDTAIRKITCSTEPPAEWKGNSAKTAVATLKAALATTLDSLKVFFSLSLVLL